MPTVTEGRSWGRVAPADPPRHLRLDVRLSDDLVSSVRRLTGSPMTQFEIATVARDRYKLSGELDMASAPALSDALGPIVDECRRLTLDLEDLTFIDSSGIRAF